MRVSSREYGNRMAHFKEACRRAGVRLTNQRIEIFRELAKNDNHPSAELIYKKIKTRLPAISLDTIYRTLWFLKDLGVISTIESLGNRTLFDAKIAHHHHFICTGCGLIRDFCSKNFDRLKIPENLKKLGNITRTHIELRGTCNKCSKKTKTSGLESKRF